ncbi:hypothetical protein GC173_01835 [bacterium]|nr:hypothetical protein [bacterium]
MELDLGVLVADDDQRRALEALLARHQALGIRSIAYRIIKHNNHDSGCYGKSAGLMQSFLGRVSYGIVVFDRDGSGAASPSEIPEMEEKVRRANIAAGWDPERIECVVIEPELESWVWSPSPVVVKVLGWNGEEQALAGFLREKGFRQNSRGKWEPPKEAMEAALVQKGKPRKSASYYGEIAKQASFKNCEDPAFKRLLTILRGWFPIP